jgi:receptor protein-tyrosine kinase
MNLIEEAARRLQQLEKAGIRVPEKPELGAQQESNGAPRATRSARAQVRAREDKRVEPFLPSDAGDGANFRKLDFARLQAGDFITPMVPDSMLLHEFRVIKRPLIQHALGRSGASTPNRNLIMVTSALAGEGKSFVALNLAMSIAMEVDCTVLLVDADVVSPSMPALLGIQPAKGLMDLLVEPGLGFGKVLLRTNVDRLALVLAGTAHRDASELLASDAMSRLLNEVSSRYPDRIVIFDSPPLLSTTESRVLASHMGQVVVVVEAERTTHGALESALSTVEGCPAVMTLLNRASESDAGAYYGNYGYGP